MKRKKGGQRELVVVYLNGDKKTFKVASIAPVRSMHAFIRINKAPGGCVNCVYTHNFGEIKTLAISRRNAFKSFVLESVDGITDELILANVTSVDLPNMFLEIYLVHKSEYLVTYGRDFFPDGLKTVKCFEIGNV